MIEKQKHNKKKTAKEYYNTTYGASVALQYVAAFSQVDGTAQWLFCIAAESSANDMLLM